MLKKYYEWYVASEAQVFNETVPFGSKVERPQIEFIYKEKESDIKDGE